LDFSITNIDMNSSSPNPIDLFVTFGATFALIGCYWAVGRPRSILERIGLAGGVIVLALMAEPIVPLASGTVLGCLTGQPLPALQTTIAAGLLGALARPVLAHFRAPTLFKHG
jgi:hypothetical protein